MLKGLLSKSVCGECRICCGFDSTDVWEMPVMNEETKNKLEALRPGTEFVRTKNSYITKCGELSDDEIFYCPALDKNTGCILGDEKPFDCKIWPYRVMNFKGSKVITVCPVCGEIFSRPLRELVDFLECGLAVKIDEYSNEYPDIVKDYDFSYPILKVLGEIKQK